MLIVLFSLSGVLSLSSTYIVLEPTTGRYATAVRIFLRQFRTLLKVVVSLMLHDLPAFEVAIAMLESQANSTQRFDASLSDSLK